MTNQDMSANPRVDQWSNGTDPAAELNRMMAIRKAALVALRRAVDQAAAARWRRWRKCSFRSISIIATRSMLRPRRWAGCTTSTRCAATAVSRRARCRRHEQRAALQALMATLKPSALALPDAVVKNLPPRPSGYEGSRELFPRNTGLMFDVITPAVVACRPHDLEPARSHARRATRRAARGRSRRCRAWTM